MTFKRKRQYFWIIAAVATVLMLWLDLLPRSWVEIVYGFGLYPVIRTILDHTTGLLPFPAASLVFGFIVWRIVLILRYTRKRKSGKWGELLMSFSSGLACIIFLFYFLWGWNYSRPGLQERLRLDTYDFDTLALKQEMLDASNDLLAHFEGYSEQLNAEFHTRDFQWDERIRPEMESLILDLGYSPRGRVQIRILHLKGFLLVWNTAGIFFPLSGEGYVDGGLHPVQWPATVAHEMAHGYGITDEGECNLIAWMLCISSDDPVVRFSGLLTYWRYVAASYRRFNASEFEEIYRELPEFIRLVLQEIRENNARYPEFFPRLRNATYDSYLKMQGVQEGLLSYNRVVALVAAFRQSGLQ